MHSKFCLSAGHGVGSGLGWWSIVGTANRLNPNPLLNWVEIVNLNPTGTLQESTLTLYLTVQIRIRLTGHCAISWAQSKSTGQMATRMVSFRTQHITNWVRNVNNSQTQNWKGSTRTPNCQIAGGSV